MAHKFSIPTELYARITATRGTLEEVGVALEALVTDLREELNEQQDALGETTEKWQESARGADVGEWVDQLETLVDELDELSTTLDTVNGNIDDLPQKPEA